ncbi:MAG: PAS domain S-box protein [Deltaproteobacteria bacterium]|nr:PAS domain S-box protein [Deltaproteobacteria bacterium]
MEKKVLVVEDDSVFRHYLYQVLKYDFNVTAVEGPLQALDIFQQNKFDLMITDLRMPDMDGRQLVEKVHKDVDPHLMVIVITAYEDDWPVDDALSTHVFRYLRKGSFLPNELKQNVNKAFEVRESIVTLEDYRRRLSLAETVYKDIFEKATDALFIADIDLKLMTVNNSFVQLSGYTLDDLQGRELLEIVSDKDRHDTKKAFEGLLSGGDIGPIDIYITKKDGTLKFVELSLKIMQGISGLQQAIYGMVRDTALIKEKHVRLEQYARDLEALVDRRTIELKASEMRFRRIAENAKDMILWLNPEGVCEYINPEVKRILGYSPEEIIGKEIPWRDFLHQDDYHITDEVLQAIKDGLGEIKGDIRVYNKTGYMLFLNYKASILYDEDRSLLGMDVVASDITQRKIAEGELIQANKKIQELNTRLSERIDKKIRELKESEARYRHIVEGSGDIVFSIDNGGRVTYVNAKALEFLRMSSSEVYGRPYHEFIPDDSTKRLQDAIEKASSGTTFPVEVDISMNTPEETRELKVSIGVVHSNDTKEFVCVGRDITDEIDNYRRLQLLANIEYYSADAVIGLDTKRRIISWNQGAHMIFGWREDEVIGKSAFIIIPDEVKKEADDVLALVKEKGFIKDLETKRITKSGKIIDVSLTITVLKDRTDQIFGFSAILRDITQQKQMEQALVQSERLAATGRLSASIAHEINNPLYGISTCLKHVLDAGENGNVDMHFVRLAFKETNRIATLISNMRDFYKPSEGKFEEVDINKVLRDVFILNQKYLEESKVNLEFKPGGIPSLMCVPDQLKQVFINFITNAVEAMPEGGTLTVETLPSKNNKILEIVFKDTGVGIPKEDLPHIFDAFFTKKSEVKGVGLGLSVSYGIIKHHSGMIDVASEEGKGTTFRIILPVDTKEGRQLRLDMS